MKAAQVREWLGELKSSRAAEEALSEQLQLLQRRTVELQQELAVEVAASAAGAAQIKELNELNVKLSGHNNQQQVHFASCASVHERELPFTPAAEDSLLGGAEEGGQCAEGVAGKGQSGDLSLARSHFN